MKKIEPVLFETRRRIYSARWTIKPNFFYVFLVLVHFIYLFIYFTKTCLSNAPQHIHTSPLVFAVDMKMEYEYVCCRGKDIAYGEPLCIMQLFVSHLDSFRNTYTYARAHTQTRIHTITIMWIEKQGNKSLTMPFQLFFPSVTKSHEDSSSSIHRNILYLQVDFGSSKLCSCVST